MGSLNSTGYAVSSFSEIKTAVQASFQSAFGSSINLSEQSPQGVWINWLSEWLDNSEKTGLNVFNNLNIDTATGLPLSYLAIARGTQRLDGTEATINVSLTSSASGYTIPASTSFTLLNTSNKFTNSVSIAVTNTTQASQFIATSNGAIDSLTIGSKLSSDTYLQLLTDVAVTDYTNGVNDETDLELQNRLKSINSISSIDDVDSIYNGLMNLDNVTKANVFENDKNSTDINSIPAHSINCVVLGELDSVVASTIYNKKAAGTPTYGTSVTSTIYDSQGYTHTIYFDRPTKLDVLIGCTCTAKEGDSSVNGSFNDIIRQGCTGYVESLRIGQNVSYSTIFGIFAKYNAFDVVTLNLGTAASTMAASNITVPLRSYTTVEVPASSITFTII